MNLNRSLIAVGILSQVLMGCASTRVRPTEPIETTFFSQELEDLYRQARQALSKRDYKRSLSLFKAYLETSKEGMNRRERLIWVIDAMGRIFLRELKDIDSAEAFFQSINDDKRLNELEKEWVAEWLAVTQEWKEFGTPPSNLKKSNLFRLGKEFFEKARAKNQFPLDSRGNADFHIAASYLIPFIQKNDKDSRIGEALYMMGLIRIHSIGDGDYWTENFYLKEVIRRFPHSDLARRAWVALNDEVHAAYTGSSGDQTPDELLKVLKDYRQLAYGK